LRLLEEKVVKLNILAVGVAIDGFSPPNASTTFETPAMGKSKTDAL
jgi:hypothetical protein